uniref:Uncharacterized protein n=1 Tax=Caenorhabditis japonica TaxID=281687 RepID=A0A8R1I8H4_CAEJA
MTTTIANAASYTVTDSLTTAHLIQTYAGITVNFAAASNVFVFYAINSEYRDAIKNLFKKDTNKEHGIAHTETSTNLEAHNQTNSIPSRSKSIISMPKFLSFSSTTSIATNNRKMTLV